MQTLKVARQSLSRRSTLTSGSLLWMLPGLFVCTKRLSDLANIEAILCYGLGERKRYQEFKFRRARWLNMPQRTSCSKILLLAGPRWPAAT